MAEHAYGNDVPDGAEVAKRRIHSILCDGTKAKRDGADPSRSAGVHTRCFHAEDGNAGAKPWNREPFPKPSQRNDEGAKQAG